MERWLVEIDGVTTGPFEANALTLRVASRELKGTTKVRRDGETGDAWTELKEVPRFARFLPTSFATSASAGILPRLEPLSAPAPLPASPEPTEVAKLETLLARVKERRDEAHADAATTLSLKALPVEPPAPEAPNEAFNQPPAPKLDVMMGSFPEPAARAPQTTSALRTARPEVPSIPEEPARYRGRFVNLPPADTDAHARRGAHHGGQWLLPWIFAFAGASIAFGFWMRARTNKAAEVSATSSPVTSTRVATPTTPPSSSAGVRRRGAR